VSVKHFRGGNFLAYTYLNFTNNNADSLAVSFDYGEFLRKEKHYYKLIAYALQPNQMVVQTGDQIDIKIKDNSGFTWEFITLVDDKLPNGQFDYHCAVDNLNINFTINNVNAFDEHPDNN